MFTLFVLLPREEGGIYVSNHSKMIDHYTLTHSYLFPFDIKVHLCFVVSC